MTSPGRLADLLIVVPCLNEERHLESLLTQLLADSGAARIVVADGGSRDASRSIIERLALEHPNLTLLDNPARIQSAGINRAVASAGRDAHWLLRVDAHCDYPRRYAEGLLEAAALNAATSVVVPMVSRGLGPFQRAAAAAQNSVLGTGGSPHRHLGTGRFVDHGHHALMRLDLFRAVGGYREDMTHNEDAELDLRLATAGARIWLEPSLALTYYPRTGMAGLWRQYFAYGRGRARTLRLHRRRPKLRQALPLAVPAAAGLAVLTPLHWIFAAPLVLWSVGSLSIGAAVGLSTRDPFAFGSGVAAMVMHLAWGLGFLAGWSGRLPPKHIAHASSELAAAGHSGRPIDP